MPLKSLEKNSPPKYPTKAALVKADALAIKTTTIAASVTAVDYTSLMPPVLDQGAQGSCVAFAETYALSFLNNQQFGYSLNHQYSKALLYNLAATSNSSGMGYITGLDILREIGYVPEPIFPYNDKECTARPDLAVLKTAINNRISPDYYYFPVGDTMSVKGYAFPQAIPGYLGINMAKALLAAGKPVVFSL